MSQLDKYFSAKLDELRDASRLRTIRNFERSLIDFSSNDYLGLRFDVRLTNASKQAIDEYGTGSGASRLLTGNSPLYDALEVEIASCYGKESACVFSSGYTANIGAIGALVEKGDLIIVDKLSHSCILEGSMLSGAKLLRFKHNNLRHLEKLLTDNRENYRNCMIISESTFSMDGDRANIKKINTLAKQYDCFTYVDFAHEIKKIKESPDVLMGTFSKAFGSLGGYVCGSKKVVDYIKTKAKSLIYSTALPASVLASSLEAVRIFNNKDGKKLACKALDNARYFCDRMALPEAKSQIVPIIIGDDKKVLELQKQIEGKGFIVSAIRPPTVPEGTARLRFSFSASHDKSHLDKLVDILKGLQIG